MSVPEGVGAIHHLALRVADPERSLVFYAGLLGLPELRRFPESGVVRSIWLRAGEMVVMLERRLAGSGPEAGSGHLLAFAVSDLAAWEKRLAAAGVTVEGRTAQTLYLRDPDGHRVGLSVFSFERAP
ncbi:MAG TPA: VOC family protein [Vicinamibacteria bacterium]|nr:VOC family protein [Vicinamibacteria bacterium]